MRYILDDNGYVEAFGTHFMSCSNKSCTAYEGSVPEGYESLEEWVQTANIKAYKVIDGELVYDSVRDAELQEIYAKECEEEKKSIIMVAINASKTISGVSAWAWYSLAFNRVAYKTGDKFSLASDGTVNYSGNKLIKVTLHIFRDSSTTCGSLYPFLNSKTYYQGWANANNPIAIQTEIYENTSNIKAWLTPSSAGNAVVLGHATNNYTYMLVEEL